MVKEDIKQIINAWDPMLIIYDYKDEDEYEFEIQAIYDYINVTKNISKELLAEFILEHFNKKFSGIFRKDYNNCLSIAEKILNTKL